LTGTRSNHQWLWSIVSSAW